MTAAAVQQTPAATVAVTADIRAVVERLAALERPPGSEGEDAAARILAEELQSRGAMTRIEAEQVHGTYWVPIGLACALAAAASTRGRTAGVLGGLISAASNADDLEIGRRPLRRLLRQRTATNVVAQLGPPHARHTLVVLAHHDAARTGLIFHPAIAKATARAAGDIIERVGGTPAPLWGAVAGPLCVALGAIVENKRLDRFGAITSAGYAAAMANIAFSRPVPGANDNLSGTAVLLALAKELSQRPPERLRVLLFSSGSEESFLEGMVRFGERHFGELPQRSTTFLAIESVGSPHLMLLSGEGLGRLYRYPPQMIEHLTELAAKSQVELREPFRYRLATNGQVPLRAGYRTAVLSSMDWYKAPSNYHWPSDRPDALHYDTVTAAARLAVAFARDLDAGAPAA